MSYSRTSTNGHLSTTAIFWQTVHTFTLVSTSLQWSLSCVTKVAVVERFNCNYIIVWCIVLVLANFEV